MGRPANWRETLTPRDAERRGTKAPTARERGDGGDRRDCYWLYDVSNCDEGQASSLSDEAGKMPAPQLQIIRDPASLPWHAACLPRHHASRHR